MISALREFNRQRVLAAVRELEVASRADLERLTGLSRGTVASIVVELQREGILRPVGGASGGPDSPEEPEDSQRAILGRPPVLVTMAAPAGLALVADVGHTHVRVAVGDAEGTLLTERFADLKPGLTGADMLAEAARLVTDVVQAQGLTGRDLSAAVLGVPAPLNDAGRPIAPRFRGLELAERVGLDRLASRVFVMNDADLGALGEAGFGAGRGLSDFIFVKVSSGVGAGLILGGRLYRGSGGLAGNIGHVRVREDGDVCVCGNRGCLQTLVSARSLIAALQAAHPGSELTLVDLFRLVGAGDPGAERLVQDAGRTVGRVLGDLVTVLNPASIVVGGSLSSLGEPLLTGMRESIGRYSRPSAVADLRVMPAQRGERAEVFGGLALAFGLVGTVETANLPWGAIPQTPWPPWGAVPLSDPANNTVQ